MIRFLFLLIFSININAQDFWPDVYMFNECYSEYSNSKKINEALTRKQITPEIIDSLLNPKIKLGYKIALVNALFQNYRDYEWNELKNTPEDQLPNVQNFEQFKVAFLNHHQLDSFQLHKLSYQDALIYNYMSVTNGKPNENQTMIFEEIIKKEPNSLIANLLFAIAKAQQNEKEWKLHILLRELYKNKKLKKDIPEDILPYFITSSDRVFFIGSPYFYENFYTETPIDNKEYNLQFIHTIDLLTLSHQKQLKHNSDFQETENQWSQLFKSFKMYLDGAYQNKELKVALTCIFKSIRAIDLLNWEMEIPLNPYLKYSHYKYDSEKNEIDWVSQKSFTKNEKLNWPDYEVFEKIEFTKNEMLTKHKNYLAADGIPQFQEFIQNIESYQKASKDYFNENLQNQKQIQQYYNIQELNFATFITLLANSPRDKVIKVAQNNLFQLLHKLYYPFQKPIYDPNIIEERCCNEVRDALEQESAEQFKIAFNSIHFLQDYYFVGCVGCDVLYAKPLYKYEKNGFVHFGLVTFPGVKHLVFKSNGEFVTGFTSFINEDKFVTKLSEIQENHLIINLDSNEFNGDYYYQEVSVPKMNLEFKIDLNEKKPQLKYSFKGGYWQYEEENEEGEYQIINFVEPNKDSITLPGLPSEMNYFLLRLDEKSKVDIEMVSETDAYHFPFAIFPNPKEHLPIQEFFKPNKNIEIQTKYNGILEAGEYLIQIPNPLKERFEVYSDHIFYNLKLKYSKIKI